MSEKFVVDGESVRGLAKLLDETGLTEIEYQLGTQRIRVVRAGVQATVAHYTPPPPPPTCRNGSSRVLLPRKPDLESLWFEI